MLLDASGVLQHLSSVTKALAMMSFCMGFQLMMSNAVQGGELWEKLTPADLQHLKNEASEKQKLARKLIRDASAYILQSCQVIRCINHPYSNWAKCAAAANRNINSKPSLPVGSLLDCLDNDAVAEVPVMTHA